MPEGPFPAISKPSNHPTFSIGFAIRARVFITAFNPLGGAQSDEANKAAHAQLRENLREKAPLVIERSGTDPTGHWSAEKSYFALGMNEEAARILGKLWHQDAVVWVGEDAVPSLILLR